MNDRYLYKAKRKHDSKFFKKGEWVDGAYYIEPYTDKCFIIQWNSTGLGFNEFIEVYGESVCQCTGLKDKNGNLIWENDIVKGKYYDNGKSHRHIGQVKYIYEVYKVVGVKQYTGYHAHLDGSYEVIGNIFDNPELLEQ